MLGGPGGLPLRETQGLREGRGRRELTKWWGGEAVGSGIAMTDRPWVWGSRCSLGDPRLCSDLNSVQVQCVPPPHPLLCSHRITATAGGAAPGARPPLTARNTGPEKGICSRAQARLGGRPTASLQTLSPYARHHPTAVSCLPWPETKQPRHPASLPPALQVPSAKSAGPSAPPPLFGVNTGTQEQTQAGRCGPVGGR